MLVWLCTVCRIICCIISVCVWRSPFVHISECVNKEHFVYVLCVPGFPYTHNGYKWRSRQDLVSTTAVPEGSTWPAFWRGQPGHIGPNLHALHCEHTRGTVLHLFETRLENGHGHIYVGEQYPSLSLCFVLRPYMWFYTPHRLQLSISHSTIYNMDRLKSPSVVPIVEFFPGPPAVHSRRLSDLDPGRRPWFQCLCCRCGLFAMYTLCHICQNCGYSLNYYWVFALNDVHHEHIFILFKLSCLVITSWIEELNYKPLLALSL